MIYLSNRFMYNLSEMIQKRTAKIVPFAEKRYCFSTIRIYLVFYLLETISKPPDE